MKKTCFILMLFALASVTTSFVTPSPGETAINHSKKKIRLYFAGQTTQPAGHGCVWVITAAGYGDFNSAGQLVGVGFYYFQAQLSCPPSGPYGYAKNIDATTTYAGTEIDDIILSKGNDPDIVALFDDGATKGGIISWLNSMLK